jgi:molecular chaperone DnaK (HSP70)
MRTLSLALAAATLLACSSRASLVVEESSPLVGPDGKTTEALGIASPYGEFIELIPQGAQVPCSKVQSFTTAHRDPKRIAFALFRGTATDTRDSHALGQYSALKPESAGRLAPVEVTFAIGADRKISLSARDPKTGKDVKLTRVR